MNKKSIYTRILAALVCTTFLYSCSSDSVSQTGTSSTTASKTEVASISKTSIIGDKAISAVIGEKVTYDKEDSYSDWKNENTNYIELKGSSAELKGSGAEIKDNVITITKAGVYAISGKLDSGQIVVDEGSKGTVRLVFNGAEITSTDNAPIYVKNAGKTIISLEEGTENVITDGSKYLLADASTNEPSAAIFSKSDLTINGTGKLTVHGNYKDGIASKDDLKIVSGNIQIYSVDDGLVGRDTVAVKDGSITIEAGGDGVKSTNDTDTTKGLVAIEGGTFNIDSADDAIHSNNSVTIAGGDLSITSGDDGVHADTALTIKGGKVNITKSYEGIESSDITISGGEINVNASDDGVNVSGGADGSSTNGRPGQNNFSSNGNNKLNISGGYTVVNSIGDGLDSNGSIYMTGGTVVVSGPTANMNGALDYDGVFEMTGGFLVSAGSSGMAQAPSEESKQYSIIMTYPQLQKAGTIVSLKDGKGNTIATYGPKKEYQAVVISSPELKKDSSYTLYSGGTSTGSEAGGLYTKGENKDGTKVVDFIISNPVTWLNESGVTTAKSSMPGGQKGAGRGNGQGAPKDPGFGGKQSLPK